MVTANQVVYTCVEIVFDLVSCVVFDQDPVAIARCLVLLVFVLIVVHVALVSRFERYLLLDVVRVFGRLVLVQETTVCLLAF